MTPLVHTLANAPWWEYFAVALILQAAFKAHAYARAQARHALFMSGVATGYVLAVRGREKAKTA